MKNYFQLFAKQLDFTFILLELLNVCNEEKNITVIVFQCISVLPGLRNMLSKLYVFFFPHKVFCYY